MEHGAYKGAHRDLRGVMEMFIAAVVVASQVYACGETYQVYTFNTCSVLCVSCTSLKLSEQVSGRRGRRDSAESPFQSAVKVRKAESGWLLEGRGEEIEEVGFSFLPSKVI